MTFASTISPFSRLMEDENWFIWSKQASVIDLEASTQTDRRSFSSADISFSHDAELPLHTALSPAVFQRNQYNAILSRFDQASKRAGRFSSWNT